MGNKAALKAKKKYNEHLQKYRTCALQTNHDKFLH